MNDTLINESLDRIFGDDPWRKDIRRRIENLERNQHRRWWQGFMWGALSVTVPVGIGCYFWWLLR